MKYGYARTRNDGQVTALQLDALKKAGAEACLRIRASVVR
jgi:hypothetical protein